MRWFLILLLAFCSKTSVLSQSSTSNTYTKEVVSFIYHRFDDSRYPSTSTSIKNFEGHLQHLTSNGYRFLTVSQAIDYLQSDSTSIKTVAITIDDGYKSFYQNAFPLLRKYNVSATLFITTETVGYDDFMTWEEIKEVQKSGIEIGNHTHSHDYFLNQPIDERYLLFESDLLESKRAFSKALRTTPTVFAYPYGELDEEMRNIVKKLDFKGAMAQNSGVMSSMSDPFQYPRFPMSDTYATIDSFKEKVSMKSLYPKAIMSKGPSEENTTTPSSLTLEFSKESFHWNNVQCFIQGSACEIKAIAENEEYIRFLIQPKTNLNQRRTLCTITVPNQSGNWHWFSHLWIDTKLK